MKLESIQAKKRGKRKKNRKKRIERDKNEEMKSSEPSKINTWNERGGGVRREQQSKCFTEYLKIDYLVRGVPH